MLQHIPRLVTSHPRICLALGLAVALLFGAFAPFVRTVDNVDYFTLEDHPNTLFYEEFKKTFGNDEFFVIAFQKPDIFTPETLEMIRDLTEKLEALDGVRRVVSLANVNETRGGDGYFQVLPFLEEIPTTRKDLEDLRARALSNPLYVRRIISSDGTTAAIVVFTDNRPDVPNQRKRLLEKTESLLSPYRARGTVFHLAGWTVLNVSLSAYMKGDVFRFIPITYVLIGLAVQWIFRNRRLTLLALANISACLAASMGFFRLVGVTLNNVTVIVPPLVMALSLSDTVHIFSHMHRSELSASGNDPRRALAAVLRRVIRPSFLTTLTTFVGFLSLGISRIPPIRDFAWTASVGMIFEFFFAFVWLPPLILCFPAERLYSDRKDRNTMARILNTTHHLVLHHPRAVVGAGLVLMLAGALLATNIRVETNLIDYFKPSDPLRRSMAFVESHLAGVGSLDVSFRAQEPDRFKDPHVLHFMESLQAKVEGLDGVDTSLCLVDFLKDMNQAFHGQDRRYHRLPESRDLIAQYLLLYDADDLQEFVNDSYDQARLSVRLSEHRSSRQAVLIDKIRKMAEDSVPKGVTVRVTGRAVQDVTTIHALVWGQVQSLVLAVGIIWAIVIGALRSWKLGLLSLFPNAFPIALNFGMMGLFHIPLNTATALIAAVAIGMAVDNTIHFLTIYGEERSRGVSRNEAVGRVILSKGKAMVSSSVILMVGFGVLVLSHFVPTLHFGLLCSVIMLTALAGDLLLLPGLLCAVHGNDRHQPAKTAK
ncbi:hypothetical protein SAMN02746041_01087 [Desulfacinum hydrothermale DSM 13146]|uniref:SSD domain-containing protein n=1 Tax=Desulfacinum hydrothermale DSM 13146 TaxID=1121390 RepID=A0A1W1XAW9_9BACT|nr:MMPL family transporter [Desulfacinum hydrothermale]SMC21009.1 hypothetical protein SAMN02746041_01087 [Desulfacinum hydrothermale DSM 13146]